jgi:hypothetical protein
VDGYKAAASASIDANRDEGWLREQARRIAAEAAAIDAAEDAEFGAARGDELPLELADPKTRARKLQAALQELEQRKQAASEAAEQTEAEGAAAGKELMRRVAAGQKTGPAKARRVDEVEVARLRLARAEAAQQAKIDADRARRAASRQRGETAMGRHPTPVEHYVAVRHAQQMLRRAMQRQQARDAVQEAATETAAAGECDRSAVAADADPEGLVAGLQRASWGER